MVSKEENDLLTLTGPGTPGGDFMRAYWHPIALADDVPEDCSPIPLRVLSEDLVLYRDGQGQLGLLGRWCSHRRMDLAHGWVEDNGLRCAWHAWLYDAAGHCLEQPMEPPDSTYRESIQHPAYSAIERGGIIFGYLGGGEPPVLPEYEFSTVAGEARASARYLLECNYLQSLEANVDPAQLGPLRWLGQTDPEANSGDATFEKMEIEPGPTAFGVRLAVLQALEGKGQALKEVRNFIMPNLCLAPANGMDGGVAHWHVPIDDTHHWHYVLAFRRGGPITVDEARQNGVQRLDGYRFENPREEMTGNAVAYAVLLAESQGPIYDRTREELGDGDRGVIAMRGAIYGGIKDVLEGADPPHVLRSADERDFRDLAAAKHQMTATRD
jgi:phenylpropionate dioxygenase-like ring-hydroxylating dioxygenase large terminal subunit